MTPTAIEVPFHSFTLSAFHFPQSSLQALETKVVAEENTGNCPVCVDPFQIGDQVPPSKLPLLQTCQSF